MLKSFGHDISFETTETLCEDLQAFFANQEISEVQKQIANFRLIKILEMAEYFVVGSLHSSQ